MIYIGDLNYLGLRLSRIVFLKSICGVFPLCHLKKPFGTDK